MATSIFRVERANVRFGDEEYGYLQKILRTTIVGICERVLGALPEHLCIRWDIAETVLHDEDAESVSDDYPVLLVRAEIVFKDKLWIVGRCPYTLIVERFGTSIKDDFGNFFGGDSSPAQIIARTLNR